MKNFAREGQKKSQPNMFPKTKKKKKREEKNDLEQTLLNCSLLVFVSASMKLECNFKRAIS